MRVGIRRPWPAIILVVVLVLVQLLAGSTPARAITGDFIANGSSIVSARSSWSADCLSATPWYTNAGDADDATYAGPCENAATYNVTITGHQDYRYFRVKLGITGAGGPTLMEVGCDGVASSYYSNDPAWGDPHVGAGRYATPSSNDTGVVDLGTTYDCTGTIFIHVFSYGAGQFFKLYQFEAYGTIGPATVPISDYMVNMRVDHPQFQWTAAWTWQQTWHGSLVVGSTPAGTVHDGVGSPASFSGAHVFTSFSANAGNAFYPALWQDCYPLCQSDSFTVVVNDTDRNQTASYTFLRSSSGAVSTPIKLPFMKDWYGCFNKTANLCGNGSAAGRTDIAFTWTGSDANLQVGQISIPNPSVYCCGGPVWSAANQSAGHVVASNLLTDTSKSPTWLLAACNAVGCDTVLVTVNYASDVAVVGSGTDTPIGQPPSACGDIDPICGLRQIFGVVAADVIAAVEGKWQDLQDALLSRQPFNFVARSLEGIGTQIDRAKAATTATTTCSGLTISLPWALWMPTVFHTPTVDYAVPTPGPSSPFTGGATSLTFHVLDCASLEPVVTSAWYSPIRAAMDPALYLLYGYAWVRKLQPRPVVSG
jgi:hypothetical protein